MFESTSFKTFKKIFTPVLFWQFLILANYFYRYFLLLTHYLVLLRLQNLVLNCFITYCLIASCYRGQILSFKIRKI